MRHVLVAVAVCSLFVTGCKTSGNGGDPKPAAAVTPNAAEVKRQIPELMRQYTKALLDKDMAALDRLWSDDLTFVNPSGDLRTKQQRMADVSSGETVFQSIHISDEKVRTYGNAAVSTCRGMLKAKYSGKESSGDYRITLVWANPTGDWKIVAIHMTPIQK